MYNNNMNPLSIGLIGLLALVIGWLVAVFNSLIKKKNRVENAWSDIDVQLKRRYDLIPNLVETVKGYKDYEASVLEKVTQARTQAFQTPTSGLQAKAQAENMLTGALKSLFAVAENYPDLKASTNFRDLQSQLSSMENDIQSARRYYNAAVRELNNALQVFPTNMIAGLLGFKNREFFGAEANEKEAVNVSF
jgi:LemA protein